MKLKFVSTLIIFSFAITLCCQKNGSEIYYVNLNPAIFVQKSDTCTNINKGADSTDIDLNSDNQNDIRLLSFEDCFLMDDSTGNIGTNNSLGFVCLNNNVEICPGYYSGGKLGHWDLLVFGDTLGEFNIGRLYWMDGFQLSSVINQDTSSLFHFINGYAECYFGLKFHSSNGDKFGWLKFNFNKSKLMLLQYAINNNYNDNILVGQAN